MPWSKPWEVDDWGNRSFYFGTRLKNCTMEEVEKKVVLGVNSKVKKGRCRVRWPDGHEDQCTIEMRKETLSVHDMGHTYDVTNEVPYLKFSFHGQLICVPIMELNCQFHYEECRKAKAESSRPPHSAR